MKIYEWTPETSVDEAKQGAYWERNMLALNFAEGWYNDDKQIELDVYEPRFEGWRRVLSLESGKITFHIPDGFEVGNLPEIERNWDGHTTREKWMRIMMLKNISEKE